MVDLAEEALALQHALAAEERSGPARNSAEIALRREKRGEMERRLASLAREVELLRRRLTRLPALPDLRCIGWAQSVLAYPNACILAVDTTPAAQGGEVVRAVLLGFNGAVRFDADLRVAPPHIWPALLEALKGRYVVSYDLEHTRRVLEKEAERCELDPIVVIGDCLLGQCLRYFRSTGFAGLESLCRFVGYPLPAPPDCAASARGQLHLLKALAQGISGPVQEAPERGGRGDPVPGERYDDLR